MNELRVGLRTEFGGLERRSDIRVEHQFELERTLL